VLENGLVSAAATLALVEEAVDEQRKEGFGLGEAGSAEVPVFAATASAAERKVPLGLGGRETSGTQRRAVLCAKAAATQRGKVNGLVEAGSTEAPVFAADATAAEGKVARDHGGCEASGRARRTAGRAPRHGSTTEGGGSGAGAKEAGRAPHPAVSIAVVHELGKERVPVAAVEAQSLEATDEQPAEVIGLAVETSSQSATVFAPPLPLDGAQAGSQGKGELIGAHEWKEGGNLVSDEEQRMPRRARWCDLAVDDVGGEPFPQPPAHVEAFPAEVDLGQLRAMVESAIGYELRGIEVHEGSAEEGTELLLQLPVHGLWSLAVAQVVQAAAGQAGARGPAHAYCEH
jgi:hypothetical protein